MFPHCMLCNYGEQFAGSNIRMGPQDYRAIVGSQRWAHQSWNHGHSKQYMEILRESQEP